MTISTVSDQIYYAYANLAMADYAVGKGLAKYDKKMHELLKVCGIDRKGGDRGNYR